MSAEIDLSGKLTSAPPSSTQYEIPGNVKYIYGADKTHYAFYTSCTTIETVTFENPSNLLEIQPYAFYNCQKLSSIDIQQCTNLYIIDSYAFESCKNLKTINLPSNLKTLGSYSFQSSGLTNVSLPFNLTKLGEYCFASCSSLQSFIIPDDSPLEIIPQACLLSCTGLTSLRLPKNTYFEGNSIGYCTSILKFELQENHCKYIEQNGILYDLNMKTLVRFPAGLNANGDYSTIAELTMIGDYSFCGSLLKKIIISEGITSIGTYAFSKSTIEEIQLPTTLTYIAAYGFVTCNNLVEVVLPEGFEILGASAFQDCTNLQSITLPSTITNIGGGVFTGIENLDINFGNESNLQLNDQDMITDLEETFISMYIGSKGTVKIRHTVEKIKSKAFYANKILTNVEFEENSQLSIIEDNAFYGCEKLVSFTFPESITNISYSAFQYCSKIQSIHFSSTFLSAGEGSFQYCTGLKSITIDEHIDSTYTLSPNAFSNCYLLESINLGAGLTTISNGLFQLSNIKTIELPSSINEIGDHGFDSCYNLETIDLLDTKVTSIGNFAFQNCYKLTTIIYPITLTSMGTYALASTNIPNVVLPGSLESIDTHCFYNCTKLESLTIPQNSKLTLLDGGIFKNCKNFARINNSSPSFTTVNEALYTSDKTTFIILPPNSQIKYFSFPDELKTIRSQALLDCTNLEIILIPSKSVQHIMENAFEGCSNLISINIPNSVKTVEKNAFLGCSKLQCGLVIENKTESYLNMLTEAGLPERSLKQCIARCTFNLQEQCIFKPILMSAILLHYKTK